MSESSILHAIFDATPECIKIVARDGTLLQMNPAGRAMLEAAENVTDRGFQRLRCYRARIPADVERAP